MKKLLATLLIGTIVLSSSSCVNAKFNYEKVANKALEASVLIRMKAKIKDKQGKEHILEGGCSGTFVSKDEILSAAHCFDTLPLTNIWVRDTSGKSYSAELIKLDVKHDLGLLRVPGLHHKHVKLGKHLTVGEEIINVGSPYFLEFLVSHGIVSAIHVEVEGFKSLYTITDAAINPGSSGGGVFNSSGELVGVNTMSLGGFGDGWSGISFAVSIENVHHFLGK
jgi:serine protease Do